MPNMEESEPSPQFQRQEISINPSTWIQATFVGNNKSGRDVEQSRRNLTKGEWTLPLPHRRMLEKENKSSLPIISQNRRVLSPCTSSSYHTIRYNSVAHSECAHFRNIPPMKQKLLRMVMVPGFVLKNLSPAILST